MTIISFFFFFQAEDGIRDSSVTGVQTCALPIWAAKGLWLLGVRAVLALSFERIHRSNLIGMGIIPLQLPAQFTPGKLALTARDTLGIKADPAALSPGARVPVSVHRAGDAEATSIDFMATAAIETALEVDLLVEGGI